MSRIAEPAPRRRPDEIARRGEGAPTTPSVRSSQRARLRIENQEEVANHAWTSTAPQPTGLHHNPAFSQVVVADGNVRTVFVGGQNALDAAGEVVGREDIGAQAQQVLRNLETALAAGGAGLENVVKWNVYIVQGQPVEPGFQAFQQAWGNRPNPPLITVLFVAGLANPEFLLEMDAIALVPAE